MIPRESTVLLENIGANIYYFLDENLNGIPEQERLLDVNVIEEIAFSPKQSSPFVSITNTPKIYTTVTSANRQVLNENKDLILPITPMKRGQTIGLKCIKMNNPPKQTKQEKHKRIRGMS